MKLMPVLLLGVTLIVISTGSNEYYSTKVTTESLYTEVIYDIVHSKVEHVITPKPSYDSITGSLHDLIELRDLYKKALEDEMAIIERLGTRIDRNRQVDMPHYITAFHMLEKHIKGIDPHKKLPQDQIGSLHGSFINMMGSQLSYFDYAFYDEDPIEKRTPDEKYIFDYRVMMEYTSRIMVKIEEFVKNITFQNCNIDVHPDFLMSIGRMEMFMEKVDKLTWSNYKYDVHLHELQTRMKEYRKVWKKALSMIRFGEECSIDKMDRNTQLIRILHLQEEIHDFLCSDINSAAFEQSEVNPDRIDKFIRALQNETQWRDILRKQKARVYQLTRLGIDSALSKNHKLDQLFICVSKKIGINDLKVKPQLSILYEIYEIYKDSTRADRDATIIGIESKTERLFQKFHIIDVTSIWKNRAPPQTDIDYQFYIYNIASYLDKFTNAILADLKTLEENGSDRLIINSNHVMQFVSLTRYLYTFSTTKYVNIMTYETLIIKHIPKYHANLERLLQKHTDLWFYYFENIGQTMNTCTDDSLAASYAMFSLARDVGKSHSTGLEIHHSIWTSEQIRLNFMHGDLDISELNMETLNEYLAHEEMIKDHVFEENGYLGQAYAEIESIMSENGIQSYRSIICRESYVIRMIGNFEKILSCIGTHERKLSSDGKKTYTQFLNAMKPLEKRIAEQKPQIKDSANLRSQCYRNQNRFRRSKDESTP